VRGVERVEQPQQAVQRLEPPGRELAIGRFLLVGELGDLRRGHRPVEETREDVGVAAAVHPLPHLERERRQAVRRGEGLEGLDVERHVVEQCAVDVEDDAREVPGGERGAHRAIAFRP
jgi:hypothetical protein